MRSLRATADLLAAADSLDSLGTLASALGFGADALPLDRDALHALGLDSELKRARVAAGTGALRALLVELADGVPPRERVTRIAAQLASRVPQLLWIVIAVAPRSASTVIAAWSATPGRPRVGALVVDRERVVPSDAETLRALIATVGTDDVLTYSRWLDLLGRDALTRRFFRALERVVAALAMSVTGRASADERGELALLLVSRLLFLSFLETKGWLDGDGSFLARTYTECVRRGGGYQRRVLEPLFFGTLNTPVRSRAAAARAFGRIPFLNGGLFARTPLERRLRGTRFSDEAIGTVFDQLFARYRFTAREDDGRWSEAAIDPEMLGKAFESLMASRERRTTGAFYTPQPIVARVAGAALAHALADDDEMRRSLDAALAGERVTDEDVARRLRSRISTIHVLDPACGSGAFLVYALEQLASVAALAGDPRPSAVVRRELLSRAIFGVDVNPTAVWLCELRLWLSVLIDSEPADPMDMAPLPNLDRHICVGDTLAGSGWHDVAPRGGGALGRLRRRYARATGARKRTLLRELDRAERAIAIRHTDAEVARWTAARRDLLAALRTRDLFGDRPPPPIAQRSALDGARQRTRDAQRRRRSLASGAALPFSFATRFGDVAARGGFDLVLGNPPWVRLHRIPIAMRASLRERFDVFARARWVSGAHAARAGNGFAAQVDLASLFIERSVQLARPGGIIALLVPAKIWHSLSGGGTRRLIAEQTNVIALEDWSESPTAFDAAVYPSTLLARREKLSTTPRRTTMPVAAAAHRRHGPLTWDIDARSLVLDGDELSSPWLVVPNAVRASWDRVRHAGSPLARSQIGAPLLGVKCGCNDAFTVTLVSCANGRARVRAGERTAGVERSLLRPVLRGETIAPWRSAFASELLVWTHGDSGHTLDRLPPLAARWLAPWQKRLAARTDARRARWWSLFRTAAARNDVARVVWADFGRAPRALVLEPGDPTVPLNSCYVIPCRERVDALALSTLLNSALCAAWLNVIAEPARGGYRRYLGWTVALLPLPNDWVRARIRLASVAERALAGEEPSSHELIEAALDAYELRLKDVAPLLTWNAG